MWTWVISIASRFIGGKKAMKYGAILIAISGALAGAYFKGRADAAGNCERARLEGELKTLELFGGIQSDNAEIRSEHSGHDDTIKRLRDSTF